MSRSIFYGYDANDIKRRMDNYVSAAYSLKLAAESLQRKASMRTKNDPLEQSSFQQQINNANNFAKATQKLAALTKQYNANFNISIPPTPIPPIP